MSGLVGSKLNIRGSGLVGSLGTDGQHFLSSGAGKTNVFETVSAAGGVLLQVVQTYKTDVSSYTGEGRTTFADISGMSVAITPTKASSKILIDLRLVIGNVDQYGTAKVVGDIASAGYADIGLADASGSRMRGWIGNHMNTTGAPAGKGTDNFSGLFLWGPSYTLTDELTVKAQWSIDTGNNVKINQGKDTTDDDNHVVACSSITVSEID